MGIISIHMGTTTLVVASSKSYSKTVSAILKLMGKRGSQGIYIDLNKSKKVQKNYSL
tara:strand:+ start:599 stop:769 length:171 start_codon:yes stop_codon:yes gene_type:complete